MTTIADELKKAHEGLGELEAQVRAGMVNKHLADVIASARGRLVDAARHPDAGTEVGHLEEKKAAIEKAKEDPFFMADAAKHEADVKAAAEAEDKRIADLKAQAAVPTPEPMWEPNPVPMPQPALPPADLKPLGA